MNLPSLIVKGYCITNHLKFSESNELVFWCSGRAFVKMFNQLLWCVNIFNWNSPILYFWFLLGLILGHLTNLIQELLSLKRAQYSFDACVCSCSIVYSYLSSAIIGSTSLRNCDRAIIYFLLVRGQFLSEF